MMQSPFLYAACRPGAENALKREIAMAYPHWRFAFSRPGFVTFKWIGDSLPGDRWRLRSVFARTYGWSLGWFLDDGDAAFTPVAQERLSAHRWDRLHVWQRELTESSSGVPTVISEGTLSAAQRFRQTLVELGFLAETEDVNQVAQHGDLVCDLVLLDDQRWAVAWHRVESWEQQWPGGVPLLVAPENMVSRAYLKMREALLWSKLPVREGDRCVEIGSAPGGACQALLEDGLWVTGIDPAPMHPLLLEHPRFTHVQKRGADVKRREYAGFRWLFADSNVAPKHTLDTVESIVTSPHTQIEGMLLTLKLMDWKLADHVGQYAHRVRSWGFGEVRCRQMACSHQEICLAAVRR